MDDIRQKNKLILFALLFFFMPFTLSGCWNIASSGAQVIYNNHSLQKSWADTYIGIQAFKAIYQHTHIFDNTHIIIATYNREVLLSGQVPAAWQKQRAQMLISKIPGVRAVVNQITVTPPISALTQLGDTWITTKIKTQFIAAKELDATQIKVVTENGTVYLMGILPHDEADVAINIARHTDGVQRVVKVFSYIHITNT